ncbi:unnamed protein product [Psylliodes chrysocephalus]|uniref:Uncharacterized protein n=1 Tax=Psylliodes chrysocephalus TaxID=3402493 RepID=A0A9P0CLB9_9CUCU|nr:unnamed protein product [Psylliodes chrysocephala]
MKRLLTIEKDQTVLNNLHNALKDSTRRLGLEKSTTIHLRGMDADTTLEDIKQSIIEITGKWKDNNKISELRPLSNDILAAILTLKSNDPDKILKEGSLRVGLVKCIGLRRD